MGMARVSRRRRRRRRQNHFVLVDDDENVKMTPKEVGRPFSLSTMTGVLLVTSSSSNATKTDICIYQCPNSVIYIHIHVIFVSLPT